MSTIQQYLQGSRWECQTQKVGPLLPLRDFKPPGRLSSSAQQHHLVRGSTIRLFRDGYHNKAPKRPKGGNKSHMAGFSFLPNPVRTLQHMSQKSCGPRTPHCLLRGCWSSTDCCKVWTTRSPLPLAGRGEEIKMNQHTGIKLPHKTWPNSLPPILEKNKNKVLPFSQLGRNNGEVFVKKRVAWVVSPGAGLRPPRSPNQTVVMMCEGRSLPPMFKDDNLKLVCKSFLSGAREPVRASQWYSDRTTHP